MKRSDSGYILKLKPRGFTYKLDEGYERKRGVSADAKVFALNHQKDGATFTQVGKLGRSEG